MHGALPALTLVLVGMGGWFISMRSLVSNIVTDDHVVYAELGGVPSRTVFSQYVARNAMLPQLTGLALEPWATSSGGAVIVEFLFNYPGIGRLLVAGIYAGDYSLVLGVTTVADHRRRRGGLHHRHPLPAHRSTREAGVAAMFKVLRDLLRYNREFLVGLGADLASSC